MTKKQEKTGFTLVEILLYFALIGTIISAVIYFSLQVLTVSLKTDNINELQSSIDLTVDKIVETIHDATSINDAASSFDTTNGALSLNMPTPTDTPTTFTVSSQKIYIQQGATSQVQLTSDAIICTEFQFQKVTSAKTPDQIVIDITCEPEFTDIPNLDQPISIHTSASLRR